MTLKKIPQYTERHRVRPGISGLAQIAGHYYVTPMQKLRFDRIYVSQISVGLDLRLLTLAFLVVFWLRWQKNWNGRIPRRWLHLDNSSRINPALGLKPDFGKRQPSHGNQEERQSLH